MFLHPTESRPTHPASYPMGTGYNCSSLAAPLTTPRVWATLISVIHFRHSFTVYHSSVITGTGMLIFGSNMRTWDSFSRLSQALVRREVLSKEVSGPHTFEISNLKFFTTTQRYIDHSSQLGDRSLCNCFSLTTFRSLSYILVLLLYFSDLLLRPPSSTFIYARPDDVMLPEPSVSRSFLYFPHCFKGGDCSGSFFTWDGGMSNWYTTPAIIELFRLQQPYLDIPGY
jgi:hypothetical protein